MKDMSKFLEDAMCTLGCCDLVFELKRSMRFLRGKKRLVLELVIAEDNSSREFVGRSYEIEFTNGPQVWWEGKAGGRPPIPEE